MVWRHLVMFSWPSLVFLGVNLYQLNSQVLTIENSIPSERNKTKHETPSRHFLFFYVQGLLERMCQRENGCPFPDRKVEIVLKENVNHTSECNAVSLEFWSLVCGLLSSFCQGLDLKIYPLYVGHYPCLVLLCDCCPISSGCGRGGDARANSNASVKHGATLSSQPLNKIRARISNKMNFSNGPSIDLQYGNMQ